MNRLSVLANIAVLIVGAIALPVAYGSDAPRRPNDLSTFTIMFENDLFADRDQQYTNGVQVSWMSRDLTQYADAKRVPEWMLPVVRRLPWINEPDTQRNVGFAVGQKIFTPENTQSSSLITDDRPYAGWLYGGLSFVSKSKRRMDMFEFQFGVVGPAAQGEQAQNFIHDLRDLPKTRGWSHQLRNEPGFTLVYERKWRLVRSRNASGIGYDIISHAGGALGNVAIYGNGGIEGRLGVNLPGDYGTSFIRPGGSVNSPTTVDDPRLGSTARIGAYVFTAVSGRVVGRDIFLDGNTFRDSHSVDKDHAVGDLVVGGSVVYRQFKLSYAQVFRSREFEQQDKNNNFGSISLSVSF